MKKICIVGTGGFAKETFCNLIDVFSMKQKSIENNVCFMEKDDYYSVNSLLGIPIIKQSEFDPILYEVVVAIGDTKLRKKVVDNLPNSTIYTSIVHPSVIISEWVNIGKGAIICANVILTCDIKIGEHSQLNLSTTVGHDCTIGDFFTTAPAVNISGNCNIGNLVYIGTNTSIREQIIISNEVIIGMGSVVVKNINKSGIFVGNPAKELKND
jgi:sugar O-acyltransferase (sialic acid O-acetyltransferase NeuD family)